MFNIGDAVIFQGSLDPMAPTLNTKGVIKVIDKNNEDDLDYGVEFEGFRGHTCSGAIAGRDGYWCTETDIRKVEAVK